MEAQDREMSEGDWVSLIEYILEDVSETRIENMLYWYEDAFKVIGEFKLDLDKYPYIRYKGIVKDLSKWLKIEYKDLPKEVNQTGLVGAVVRWRLKTGK